MRLIAVLLALVSAGCGPNVDLGKALQIDVVDSGWFDAGIVNGQNKLVPAIRVTVKNSSDQQLVLLQINSLFRHGDDTEEWGSAFLTAAGSEGLAPGATTGTLLLKSQNGYTGTDETRQDMLKNSRFVDAKVQLFAKYGSVQWVRMGEHPIKRQLLEK
ncbi:MAG TPA: hypothetical protein VGY48_35385 [Vicinamibacterales bacterium]|jgi:hypothetical protein|nr:hypothetical protein [Vicinamibacterales bacterium]